MDYRAPQWLLCRAATLDKLCKALDLTLADLLTYEEESTNADKWATG